MPIEFTFEEAIVSDIDQTRLMNRAPQYPASDQTVANANQPVTGRPVANQPMQNHANPGYPQTTPAADRTVMMPGRSAYAQAQAQAQAQNQQSPADAMGGTSSYRMPARGRRISRVLTKRTRRAMRVRWRVSSWAF